MTTRAVAYCRISEDREGRELGVDRQEQDCRALIAQHGWHLVEVYIDNDLSASTKSKKSRPRYQQMLADARRGMFDVIVAYTSGRLTRRPREHEDLIDLSVEYGVRYEYVRSPSFDLNTAQGRRVARTLAAQDAGEAEEISERVLRAKLQAATEGLPAGGRRPYGYDDDGMTIRPDEAEEVLRMSKAVLAGASLLGLATELNERGVRSSTGSPWRQDNVRGVLMRARNAGLRRHQGVIIGKAAWPAIVPEQTWRAVDALLRDPARRTNYSTARIWLGGGLYLCGLCADGTLVRTSKTTASRQQARTEYSCRKIKHVTRVAQAVDDYVVETLIERLGRPDAAQLLEDVDAPSATTGLHDRAVELRGRLNGLARLFGAEAIDERQLAEGSAPLRAQLNDIERRMAEVVPGRSVLAGLIGADDVAEAWDAFDIGEQRTAIDALVTVTLLPSGKGRPAGWKPGASYFRPDTVKIEWRRARSGNGG